MNRAEKRNYAKRFNTPQKLENYSAILEKNIRKEYDKKYEEFYKNQLIESIDIFILSIIYTLHYNEKTKFGNERIQDFMDDLLATVHEFEIGGFNPEDYRKQLEADGIKIITSKERKK